MDIKILCFGKMDNKDFDKVLDFYKNKIKLKANLEIIELREEFNAETIVNIKTNSNLLEEKLSKYEDYEKIIMDVKSKEVSSEDFAKILDENKNFKGAKIIYIIGPSDGFSDDFKNKYKRISFGKITLPHQLFRIMLIEQIYRGLKINNNEKYHK